MIIVTGGTGLVGSYLLLLLAKEKRKVRVLIRPGSNPRKVFSVWKHYIPDLETTFSQFEWHPVDHSSRAELEDALLGAENIYHCAGKVSFDPRDKAAMWETNVNLTGYIVDFCLAQQVKKLAYVSSVAAISGLEGEDAMESSGWPSQKKSVYARTKTLGEFEVWRGIAEGLEAVIINPSVILGPGNWKQSSAKIFNSVDTGMPFYTGGMTGFVDNRDVAEALVQLMRSDIHGERFILNAANLSYQEIFSSIANELGKKPPRIFVSPIISGIGWRIAWLVSRLTNQELNLTKETARSAHRRSSYSARKITERLGFKFREIEDTIRDTSQCYLKEFQESQPKSR